MRRDGGRAAIDVDLDQSDMYPMFSHRRKSLAVDCGNYMANALTQTEVKCFRHRLWAIPLPTLSIGLQNVLSYKVKVIRWDTEASDATRQIHSTRITNVQGEYTKQI